MSALPEDTIALNTDYRVPYKPFKQHTIYGKDYVPKNHDKDSSYYKSQFHKEIVAYISKSQMNIKAMAELPEGTELNMKLMLNYLLPRINTELKQFSNVFPMYDYDEKMRIYTHTTSKKTWFSIVMSETTYKSSLQELYQPLGVVFSIPMNNTIGDKSLASVYVHLRLNQVRDTTHNMRLLELYIKTKLLNKHAVSLPPEIANSLEVLAYLIGDSVMYIRDLRDDYSYSTDQGFMSFLMFFRSRSLQDKIITCCVLFFIIFGALVGMFLATLFM